MDLRRFLLLLTAIALLTCGGWFWSGESAENQMFAGIFMRVGFMLLVLWLAYHQLESFKKRTSWLTLAIVVFFLLLVAARPRIFPIAAGIALGSFFLNGLLRKLAGKSSGG
ncbi:MAG: hypothetical protein MK108_16800 [Mariniblastus sp.]|nr:hypothetical protein [Mariniblastus sp.]